MSFRDLGPLHAMLSDPHHMRFYPATLDEEGTRGWIRWILRHYRVWGYGLYGIELRDEPGLAGFVGLTWQLVDHDQYLEVGWHVRADLWGRGLAPEAATACRNLAFGTLGAQRVISLIRPENEPSARVAQKIGMKVWRETTKGGLLHHVYSATGRETAPG